MRMKLLSEILDEKYAHDLDHARSIGIDIGSRGAKAVLLYDGKIYDVITASGVSSKKTSYELVEALLKQSGIAFEDIHGIVGSGYGSLAMQFDQTAFQTMTEITCHGMGAHYLHADTKTIVDIGGQDSKAIKIDSETGKVLDFVMNDKCAAGTGRFLEKVAQILEIPLRDLGAVVLQSNNPCEISSQCVVFAESEIVSLRAQGSAREDIAYGVHLAAARRIKNLLKRTGFENDILFTGGVNNNSGMRRALEETIEKKIANTGYNTVFAGALGAAVYASGI